MSRKKRIDQQNLKQFKYSPIPALEHGIRFLLLFSPAQFHQASHSLLLPGFFALIFPAADHVALGMEWIKGLAESERWLPESQRTLEKIIAPNSSSSEQGTDNYCASTWFLRMTKIKGSFTIFGRSPGDERNYTIFLFKINGIIHVYVYSHICLL